MCRARNIGITGKIALYYLVIAVFLSFSFDAAAGESAKDFIRDLEKDGFQPVELYQWKDTNLQDKVQRLTSLANESTQANLRQAQDLGKVIDNITGHAKAVADVINFQNQQKVKTAGIISEFNYVHYPNDAEDYFQDGLLTKRLNEPIHDEFHNKSTKDTFYKYDLETRLPIYSDSILTDPLGNQSTIRWFDVIYKPGSVFYGGPESNADRLVIEYKMETVDHAGNRQLVEWKGLDYPGKYVTEFWTKIQDDVYGVSEYVRSMIDGGNKPTYYYEKGYGPDHLMYEAERWNTWENGQLAGFKEVRKIFNDDGTLREIRTTEGKYEYGPGIEYSDDDSLDVEGRLARSIVTTTSEFPDGSFSSNTEEINYTYEGQRLVSAFAQGQVSGRTADWYDQDDIRQPGAEYNGYYTTAFEIMENGRPMPKLREGRTTYMTTYGDIDRWEDNTTLFHNELVNNIPRLVREESYTNKHLHLYDQLELYEHTEYLETFYVFKEDGIGKGNLIGAFAIGEAFDVEYDAASSIRDFYRDEIYVTFKVFNGVAKEEDRAIVRHLKFEDEEAYYRDFYKDYSYMK